MKTKILFIALLVVAGLLSLTGIAKAAALTWIWSLADESTEKIIGHGQFITGSDLGNGVYLLSSMTGLYEGAKISGLAPYHASWDNNNLFYSEYYWKIHAELEGDEERKKLAESSKSLVNTGIEDSKILAQLKENEQKAKSLASEYSKPPVAKDKELEQKEDIKSSSAVDESGITFYTDSPFNNNAGFGSVENMYKSGSSKNGAVSLANNKRSSKSERGFNLTVKAESEESEDDIPKDIPHDAATPESSTYGLIGIGALAVAFAARRRKLKTV